MNRGEIIQRAFEEGMIDELTYYKYTRTKHKDEAFNKFAYWMLCEMVYYREKDKKCLESK